MLIIGLNLTGGAVLEEKYLAGAPGQKIKEDFDQLPGVDGPAICRKAHLEPGDDPLLGDLAGGPGQDLRPWMANSDEAALSRALGLKIEPGDLLVELAHQVILQGPLLVDLVKERRRIAGPGMGHKNAELGGGGKGIPLHVVDGQSIIRKIIGPLSRLVGRVASSVNGF